MGIPFRPSSPTTTTTTSASSFSSCEASRIPHPSDAAAKTAALIENFQQHAAEWAAASSSSPSSSSALVAPFLISGDERNDVGGGVEVALERWRQMATAAMEAAHQPSTSRS